MFTVEEKEVVLRKLKIERVYLEEELLEEQERAACGNGRPEILKWLEDQLAKVNDTISKVNLAEEK